MTTGPDIPSCPFCDQRSVEEEMVCPDSAGVEWRYRSCRACGGYCLHPLPTVEEQASFYDAEYYGAGENKFPSVLDAVRNIILRRRAIRARRWLGRSRGNVLDVGCGDGRFLGHMKSLGFAIAGTELPGIAFERAQRLTGATLHAGPLQPGIFPERSFDMITIWHVLEHVLDPQDVLRICRSLIKDDGLLIVEVPNVDSWQSRLGGGMAFNLDPPRHIHQFERRTLDLLVQKAGFTVAHSETGSLEMGVMGAMQTLLNRFIKPRDLLFNILRSRFACPGTPVAKGLSVLMAPVLLLPSVAFTMMESCFGRGAVLRYVCRPEYAGIEE